MNDSDPKDVRTPSGPTQKPAGDASKPQITLAEALSNKWLEIWYQPKIDLKRKYLTGAEATARVRHPRHGVLPPASFLADVDEKGLAELAQTALLAALFDWETFEEAGFNLHLSLNIPVAVLFKLPIPRLIAQNRPHSKRWPGLILEVTADEIARATAIGKDLAAHLRVSGISIAVDHFGDGYASMASLRNLPFAELKIHQSFVTGCAVDAANAAICQTAIDLAHRFGSVAVAEDLERASDLQALIAMGCDFGQGTLIAPAMPKARLFELLRASKSAKPAPAAKDAANTAPDSVGRVA
jgi:EAL domain-containing protein (putative c-di-GMP-specific phosphodiesterase class I)